jgi:hypothetical protein
LLPVRPNENSVVLARTHTWCPLLMGEIEGAVPHDSKTEDGAKRYSFKSLLEFFRRHHRFRFGRVQRP